MSTASKIKKNITRKNLKKEYGKIHDRVINVSEETVEVTVDNLEKWQNMFSKGFTASTPLVEKGIDFVLIVERREKAGSHYSKEMPSLPLPLPIRRIQAVIFPNSVSNLSKSIEIK